MTITDLECPASVDETVRTFHVAMADQVGAVNVLQAFGNVRHERQLESVV